MLLKETDLHALKNSANNLMFRLIQYDVMQKNVELEAGLLFVTF